MNNDFEDVCLVCRAENPQLIFNCHKTHKICTDCVINVNFCCPICNLEELYGAKNDWFEPITCIDAFLFIWTFCALAMLKYFDNDVYFCSLYSLTAIFSIDIFACLKLRISHHGILAFMIIICVIQRGFCAHCYEFKYC